MIAQALLQQLRDWRWADSGWAVFVGAATLFANGTPLGNPGLDMRVSIALLYNVLQFGFPLVLLLGFAHRLVDQRLMAPALAYPLVVLIEVVCGVWLIGPLLEPLLGAEPWWTEWNNIVLASTTVFWHGLGVAVVAQRRLNQRAEAARVAAELQHAERQRELAATELLALQARVDPPLLFERLQRIDAELASSPEQARRRLGALIDLLRALQPHAQASESLLGRELDALQAYARLSSREAQGNERLLVSLPEALLTLPMAPLVLLPLLRPLLADPGAIWQLTGEVAVAGRPARLHIDALGPDGERTWAAARQVELDPLRARLRAVLGPAARLEIGGDDLPRFTLQWP